MNGAPDTGGTPTPSQRSCERQGEVRDFGGKQVAEGPCTDREGRPVLHGAYVAAAASRRLLTVSLLLLVALPILLVGTFAASSTRNAAGVASWRRVLSPAATSSLHAGLDCAQCHRAGANVEDARCERCHDTARTARLSTAAHAFTGAVTLGEALATPDLSCVSCHIEHRGAKARLDQIDDRECGRCHETERGRGRRLTSLDGHPEFAIVAEQRETASGLRWFNHQRHLQEVRDKGGGSCDACHRRPQNAATFAPISFASHCARCHEKDLETTPGALPAAVVAALGALPSPLRTMQDLDDPARWRVTGVAHADQWVLRTVHSLGMAIDAPAATADRVVAARQLAQLELFALMENRLPALDGLLPAPSVIGQNSNRPTRSTGQEVGAAASAVGGVLTMLKTSGVKVEELQRAASGLSTDSGVRPEQRRDTSPDASAALRRLVLASRSRAQLAGASALVARADTLLRQLEALAKSPGTSSSSATFAMAAAPLLNALMLSGDPGVREQARRLRDMADVSQRIAAGSMDPSAFDAHRRQVMLVLDATQKALAMSRNVLADRLPARLTALRHRVLASNYANSADVSQALTRRWNQRDMARAMIDAELEASDSRVPASRESRPRAAVNLELRLTQVRRLAATFNGPAVSSSLVAENARATITALLGTEEVDRESNASGPKNRCTLCHELDANGRQLAPMRAAGRTVLTRARFDHSPHVAADGGNCQRCHDNVAASTSPRDVNLPPVASCRGCHVAGRQASLAASCQSCHRYHVSSEEALVWVP